MFAVLLFLLLLLLHWNLFLEEFGNIHHLTSECYILSLEFDGDFFYT